MNPLRSVGASLALAMLVVVTGALAIVYLIVVPRYESSLVNARVAGLERSLRLVAAERTSTFLTQQWVEDVAAPYTEARVVVFSYLPSPPVAEATADSSGAGSRDVENDSFALLAERVHHVVHGTVSRNDQRYAEAAMPIGSQVLLLAAPLHNQLETVKVIQRQVFIAGGFAIGFAILLAYVLANLFARRIRRLERSVEQIAAGRFDEAVVDPSGDELGQLARAVERMRLRLATLDRARAEFIANASHELRTPLHSLGGFLELLAGEELDGETRDEFVAAMREQVARLTKLATDLLDLSRMDAGRLAVAEENLDLARLGETVVLEFGPRAAASGQAFEVGLDDSVPARGDGDRVLQIGRILVENALVHTPAGTTVRVSAVLEGGRAVLAVEDNGPGIPTEAQAQVFERFYRLEGTIASGSGLGLAIARELAELMGGRIELQSGGGRTTFALVLPAGAAAERPPLVGVEVG
jgi:two-component system OmpR family sensor kinase